MRIVFHLAFLFLIFLGADMRFFPVILFSALLINGCSNESKSHLSQIPFDPWQRYFFNIETNVSAYIPAASRVSVIDPDAGKELYGFDVAEGFTNFANLSTISAVAVFNQSILQVLSRTEQTSLSLSAWQYWDKANKAAALAFSSADSQSIDVWRRGAGGKWTKSELAFAGSDAVLVPFLSSDGTSLVAFRPVSSRIAYFSADGTSIECMLTKGTGNWTSAIYDSTASRFLIGDSTGQIAVFALSKASCPTSATTITLSQTSRVLGIAKSAASDVYWVTAQANDIYSMNLASATPSIEAVDPVDCDYPVFPTELDSNDLAFMCLGGAITNATTEAISYQVGIPSVFSDEPAGSGAVGFCEIDLRTHLSVSANPTTTSVSIVRNSIFGNMGTYFYTDHWPIETTNMFIQGLLNRL